MLAISLLIAKVLESIWLLNHYRHLMEARVEDLVEDDLHTCLRDRENRAEDAEVTVSDIKQHSTPMDAVSGIVLHTLRLFCFMFGMHIGAV